jgi:hypothetical protein
MPPSASATGSSSYLQMALNARILMASYGSRDRQVDNPSGADPSGTEWPTSLAEARERLIVLALENARLRAEVDHLCQALCRLM